MCRKRSAVIVPGCSFSHETIIDGTCSKGVIHFCFVSDRRLVRSAIHCLKEFSIKLGHLTAIEWLRISVALEECLLNAVIHGNLEVSSELRDSFDNSFDELIVRRSGMSPYKDRRVTVIARSSRDALRYRIRDEGKGLDVFSLPDPTAPENLMKAYGRGVLLMRRYMDEVNYTKKGNEVILVKRKEASAKRISHRNLRRRVMFRFSFLNHQSNGLRLM